MPIEKQYWDGTRWQGHLAFRTVGHTHVSCYSPAKGRRTCDITAVECEDGRWYIEDTWGSDAKGASGVWNPFDPSDDDPLFFESEEAALRHAASIVATICGVSEAELLTAYLDS